MTMVTPRSGFDLEYYLGRAAGEKTAGGYYINAAREGEPPGRWFGKGAEALGFTDGQGVERDPYLAAYQQTDPNTGEKLGRAPVGYRRFGGSGTPFNPSSGACPWRSHHGCRKPGVRESQPGSPARQNLGSGRDGCCDWQGNASCSSGTGRWGQRRAVVTQLVTHQL